MKKFCLTAGLCILVCNVVKAQYPTVESDSFLGYYNEKIPEADTIFVEVHNSTVYNPDYVETYILKWGTNQVTYFLNGEAKRIFDFDEQGNIVEYRQPEYNLKETYQYDDLNRISIRNGSNLKYRFYYTGENLDSCVRWDFVPETGTWYKTDKHVYTFSGDSATVEYLTFNNDTEIWESKDVSNYWLDSEGRILRHTFDKIRIRTYEYGLNSYIKKYYTREGRPFSKDEYEFNDKGDVILHNYDEWRNSSYWAPMISEKYRYAYKNSSIGDVGSNENWRLDGGTLFMSQSQNVKVVDINGRILKTDNSGIIRLPSGIYIIMDALGPKKIVVH